jgi:mannosyltransferase OCH1-like enzyme
MFEQLENEKYPEDIPCYIYSLVEHIPLTLDLPKPTSKIKHIPKTINYIWFGGGEIPKQQRIWMESWGNFCPDYAIIRWENVALPFGENKIEVVTTGKIKLKDEVTVFQGI